ncbi:MAG: hypothetical protein GX558_06585 [Clostridiales bacterium]|nr:hypothetical protein [Clostridiales bacterium]
MRARGLKSAAKWGGLLATCALCAVDLWYEIAFAHAWVAVAAYAVYLAASAALVRSLWGDGGENDALCALLWLPYLVLLVCRPPLALPAAGLIAAALFSDRRRWVKAVIVVAGLLFALFSFLIFCVAEMPWVRAQAEVARAYAPDRRQAAVGVADGRAGSVTHLFYLEKEIIPGQVSLRKFIDDRRYSGVPDAADEVAWLDDHTVRIGGQVYEVSFP